ncbi:L-aspartate oxidase [Paludicola sp. MB14-C6]|uniref:L-aspartate oxidase n=1 Tax=Paludihabitans sp. MB14-C6 TaxID=3070656 RepID=UPI0027DAE99E|nr:L-aspartate oxidase [Paludicola sp. MB14-C6]WMJ24134.1 L-aspartate oxidase [Paludicola sp. MB14-C6]
MQNITEQNYDVIIVGGGVAGLYTALNLDPSLKVLLLTKRELTLSNSSLAQGGIATVYDKQNDSFEEHFEDTLIAGGFQNDKEHVKILVEEGPDDVQKLIDYGVDFDKNAEGKIHLTLEGGHSKSRILHYKDCTGKEIVDKLILAVTKLPNVTVQSEHVVCDLKKTNHTFHLDIIDENNMHSTLHSNFVVLCTGGIGRVYEYTTNSAIATGDGIALAYRLGATIKNLHLVQFHPTAFANKNTRESFLISESVRGEGAYLLNCNYQRFMHRYDERLELAPRDVVSRSIMEEAKRTGSNNFYLDITHKNANYLKKRFPMIYASLLLEGYDLTKDRIPIFPCQHYLMGGIDVNENAQSSIEGLYACGECSHTGVHGNNRLASNSLLEGIVFSRRCAVEINHLIKQKSTEIEPYTFEQNANSEPIFHGIRTEIRSIMQQSHFVTPNLEEAKKGFQRIGELLNQIESGNFLVNRDFVEARSLATVAYLILKEVI